MLSPLPASELPFFQTMKTQRECSEALDYFNDDENNTFTDVENTQSLGKVEYIHDQPLFDDAIHSETDDDFLNTSHMDDFWADDEEDFKNNTLIYKPSRVSQLIVHIKSNPAIRMIKTLINLIFSSIVGFFMIAFVVGAALIASYIYHIETRCDVLYKIHLLTSIALWVFSIPLYHRSQKSL